MNPSSTEMSPAFWSFGNGEGEIAPGRVENGSQESGPLLELETVYSAVSRGTEALVFNGQVPASEYQRMRAPFQEGDFPGPVRYGYMNVGRVVTGPTEAIGRYGFVLFPHQRRYRVPASAVTLLPETLPPGRAVLAANLETAINGLWDGEPLIGDRVAIIGCGVVGCLVAWLASGITGTRVTAVDPNPHRKPVLASLGVDWAPELTRDDQDLVFHTSGHPAGLETALALAGNEGRIIEMSWYGEQTIPASLGGSFHSRRLTLRSSQVGQLSPRQLPRWNHSDRMALAIRLLENNPQLDNLITGESDFEQLPDVMSGLARGASDTLCHRIRYS